MDICSGMRLWMFHWVWCLGLWFGHGSGFPAGYANGVHCCFDVVAHDQLSPCRSVPPFVVRVADQEATDFHFAFASSDISFCEIPSLFRFSFGISDSFSLTSFIL